MNIRAWKPRISSVIGVTLTVLILTACSSPSRTTPTLQKPTEDRLNSVSALETPPATQMVRSSPTAPSLQPKFLGTLGKGVITGIYRTPNGKRILTTEKNILRIFDASSFQEMGSVQSSLEYIGTVYLSPDGQQAALSGMYQSTAEVVDVEKQEVIAAIQGEDETDQVVFTTNNRYAVFRSRHASVRRDGNFYWIGLWNLQEDKLVLRYAKPDDPGTGDSWGWASAWTPPAVSPDEKLVAAGSDDRQVYLWDLETGRTRFVLEGHASSITGVDFSPDGQILASSSEDGTVRLWNATNGTLIQIVTGFDDHVSTVEFSQDGKLLYTDNSKRPWNLETGLFVPRKEEEVIPDPFLIFLHKQGYFDVPPYTGGSGPAQFSMDGRLLAVGIKNILIWNVDDQRLVQALEVPHAGQKTYIASLVFHPDGSLLAGYTHTGDILTWDIHTGQIVWALSKQKVCQYTAEQTKDGWIPSQDITFSPDGSSLVFGCGDTVQVWDYARDRQLAALTIAQENLPTGLMFSKDGKHLYVVQNWPHVIQVWNMTTLQKEKQIDSLALNMGSGQNADSFHPFDLSWPAFSRYYYDGQQYQFELWNLETGRKIVSVPSLTSPNLLGLNPSGTVLMAELDNLLFIWSVDSGKLIDVSSEPSLLDHPVFSHDSSLLAEVNNGVVELWDFHEIQNAERFQAITPAATPTPATPINTPYPSQTPIPTQFITPIATPELPKNAILPENAAQVSQVASFGGGTVEEIRWSPDGKRILVSGSQGVFQYDSNGLTEISHLDNALWIFSAAFLPDGSLRSVGRAETQVSVWDQTGGLLFEKDAGSMQPVLSANGEWLSYSEAGVGEVVRNLDTQQVTRLHGFIRASHVLFSPDNQLAAAPQWDGSVRVWEVQNGTIVNALIGPEVGYFTQFTQFNDLAFSCDGKWLVGAIEGSVWLWDAYQSTPPQVIELYTSTFSLSNDPQDVPSPAPEITTAALYRRQDLLAVATSSHSILLVDLDDKQVVRTLDGLSAPARHLAFSPDGARLLAVDDDGGLYLWEVHSGKRIAQSNSFSGKINGIRFASDGALFGWQRNTIWKMKPLAGNLLEAFTVPTGSIFAVHPEREEAVIYAPYQLSVWAMQKGEPIRTLSAIPQAAEGWVDDYYRDVYSAQYSQDGHYLVVAGTGGVWVYRATDGQLVQQFSYHSTKEVAISPDSRRLAFCRYALLGCEPGVFELLTGQMVQGFEEYRAPGAEVDPYIFTPDGRYLISRNGSQWDAITGRLLDHKAFPVEGVVSLVLSPNGKVEAIGLEDGKLLARIRSKKQNLYKSKEK